MSEAIREISVAYIPVGNAELLMRRIVRRRWRRARKEVSGFLFAS
jgi:hypothetical protein